MKKYEDDGICCYIETDELKKCPFCGSGTSFYRINPHTHQRAKFMPDYDGGYFIECNRCTAAMSGETEQEIIDAWNRRTSND